MKKSTVAASIVVTCLVTGAAWAQPAQVNAGDFVPLQAGTFELRARAIGIIPENLSSSVSLVGGHIDVTATPAPELDLSYHFTDNLALELIAASTRHEVAATGTLLGRVDVGSVYVLPPTLTAQWHFLPHERFDPYVGAGLTLAFFYDSSPAGPTVTKLGLSNNAGAAIQAGFDYSLGGPWVANFDIKQIFVDTTARLNGGVIVAHTSLDPTGIGFRF